jgi:hypothetical protein
MKRDLTQDELIEHWTLAPSELVLLMGKSGPGRVGFAALLKFFQSEGRFPSSESEVPEPAIEYLVRQTQVAPSSWTEYDWQGRTIKYHRAEIRSLFGFREAMTEDGEAVMGWLREHVIAQERHPERILEAALRRFRELKIEPPTVDRLERMVRSALRTFEDEFGQQILNQLSPTTTTRLDALLETSSPESAGVPLHDLRRSRSSQHRDFGGRVEQAHALAEP